VELVQFDLAKEKEILGVWLLSYLGRGHSTFLGSSGRCFGGVLIYCESGTISPRGRAQPWSGSTHGKGPSFILQQGELSIIVSRLQIYSSRVFWLLLVPRRKRAEIFIAATAIS
jgi:hypothetical protein